MLFEPDTSGRVPPGILVPWTPQRIEGGIERTKDYSVVSKTKHCLLLDVPVRVWPAEEKKLYAVLPKTKDIGAAVAALHKIETVLVVQTAQSLPHCEISNAIVYP
ncbi:MAG: hypothetical protein H7249_20570 [Chitinophagaceae bacterium]|nr:hypothetical protein [Oligoflexus sp.]